MLEEEEDESIYNADDTGLFCMLPPNKTVSLKGDPCCGGENSRKRVTVLLVCNISGTDRLLQLLLRTVKPHIAIKLPYICNGMGYTDHLCQIFKDIRCQNDFLTQKHITLCGPMCCSSPRHTLPKEG